MSDMNFFSSYGKKTEKKKTEKSLLFINSLIILILIGTLSYGAFNYLTIRKLSNEIAALNTEFEDSGKNQKLSEILAMGKKVSALKEDLAKLNKLDRYIDDIDIINESVLESIRINTPSELFLGSMVMNAEGIMIEGISKDKRSIAQFEHNLRELEGWEKIFVSRITDEKGYYSFYLNIDMKEEMPDGAKAAK